MIEWKIISSGSKGNCVIVNDVMIDCGVPFKRIKEHLYDIDYLLLTHIHSDHINSSTLENIRKLFPKITIIGNYQIAQLYDIDIIGNSDFKITLPSFEVTPFECFHDVITQGYTWRVDGENIIYAT
ncbi:MBL fold metallo-hydrolase, partial [Listeria monocytogenes]|nr:MBL fold metallo-hydrolase [Listeria monocytogenes]